MFAWRLCRAAFANRRGEGARLYGGRWNSAGQALVYTASSAALAVLEVRVHLDLAPELIPEDYVLMKVDLAGLAVERLDVMPDDPRAFGDLWLRERRSPVLRVPSMIIPEDENLLFNPAHPLVHEARIVGTRPFAFDRRLWLPL
jgi:RES domain-containing protein